MGIWITQDFIKSKTPAGLNIEPKELVSSIETTQFINTRDILGKLLYDDLDTKITNGNLNERESELYEILKYAIAFRTLETAIPFLSMKLTPKGVINKNDEYSSSVDLNSLKYVRAELNSKAEYFEKRANDYLCLYMSDFPLWSKSKDENENKQEIYPNQQTFDTEFYLEDGLDFFYEMDKKRNWNNNYGI